AYTFSSRSPRPAHPAVLNRRDFVEAAPTLPGDPRLRLPPASPPCYDSEAMDGLSPPSGVQQCVVAHAVVAHAFAYRPSLAAFSRTSLTKPRNARSPFFKPMPYGSCVNWAPTSWKLAGSVATKPVRMTLSEVTASTCLFFRASAHLL